MKNKKKGIKQQNITQLILSLIIIILINIISSFVFTRFDLTSEKRYTLSDATKNQLKNLDDIVYFKIYLEGDFPAGFKRLKNETKEMLDEFRAYSDNIQYEFINPLKNKDKKSINKIYKQLVEKGLEPTDLHVKNTGASSQQIIFPGALVSYKGKELALQLLITQIGTFPEAVLNNSIQVLEYNISSIIRKLTIIKKPKIAFITGHGELNKYDVADISYSLSEYYDVERIKINGKLNSLSKRELVDSTKIINQNKYSAIIIAKPDSTFDEKDKFIIDQFIMNGGKVLWLIDPVFASMDSLKKSYETIGIANDLNLEDQLFNYGVRINKNLILDLNALPIPVVTGQTGDKPQQTFLPWYFFPVIVPRINHPIVNNLNVIKCEFVSSLDTVGTDSIKKTILLTTSPYSRFVNAPCRINLDLLMHEPDKRQYNRPNLPIAVLLQGKFKSVFQNRIPPVIRDNKEIKFKGESKKNSMIVVSDGDIIKNQVKYLQDGSIYPYPLGYDKYTRQTFGNKDFILNAVNYLCDESGLISVRSKELKLRLLDRQKVNNNKLSCQILNILIPILLVIILGIIQYIIRKQKYA